MRDGQRSPGTDTLPRVRAWCLSLSEPGQAEDPLHSQEQRVPQTTEPVPEQDVDRLRGEPAQPTDFLAHLSACRSGESAVAAEALMNNAG